MVDTPFIVPFLPLTVKMAVYLLIIHYVCLSKNDPEGLFALFLFVLLMF